ncbi:hypothetical protein RFI_04542 [Reticulomyxa filosa]|uniref:OB domain-containing protein n=1 Tax=Reticulomyxa filosa TaxID=46433 RepID=X6P4R6_RETFI|nr:hypothetical protein RFI_04542 [Reticulomyxa filosa]|eukprot:ETO32577.1 hypothetical protein RFI_04542 [Reticulomyxa filosa]
MAGEPPYSDALLEEGQHQQKHEHQKDGDNTKLNRPQRCCVYSIEPADSCVGIGNGFCVELIWALLLGIHLLFIHWLFALLWSPLLICGISIAKQHFFLGMAAFSPFRATIRKKEPGELSTLNVNFCFTTTSFSIYRQSKNFLKIWFLIKCREKIPNLLLKKMHGGDFKSSDDMTQATSENLTGIDSSILPVFVKQLANAKGDENDAMTIDGKILTYIKLCGSVEEIDSHDTYTSYMVRDNSGMVQCRFWNPCPTQTEHDTSGLLHKDKDKDTQTNKQFNVSKRDYVEVFGRLNNSKDGRYVNGFVIRKLEDRNQWLLHMCEVIYASERNKLEMKRRSNPSEYQRISLQLDAHSKTFTTMFFFLLGEKKFDWLQNLFL